MARLRPGKTPYRSISLLLALAFLLLAPAALGYVDTATPHTSTIFNTWGGKASCRLCHGGVLGKNQNDMHPTESTRIFENYRCIACHTDSTGGVVEAVAGSPHKAVGCTYCHDVLHWGHSSYDTSTRGLYGCMDGCHRIVSEDYTAPTGADVTFGLTYRGARTGDISYPTVWARFFNPTATGPSGKNVYPDAYMDPYTGDYDAIPSTKSYWVCLKCHFVNRAPTTTLSSTYFVDHPAICYSCHSNTTGYTSTYILEPHAVMEHSATSSWASCRNCHTNLAQAVDSSIHGHRGAGCRCHSMIHVSKYNGSASWVYLYPSPATKDYVSPECTMCHLDNGNTTDVTWWRTVFYYNSTNATTFNVPIYPFSAAGDTKYANVFYLMRSGDATPIAGPEMRWATCLNCHFIAGASGGALPARFEGRIPLPEEALRNIGDPHSIQPLSASEGGNPVSGKWGLAALVVALTAVAALIVLMGRVRGSADVR